MSRISPSNRYRAIDDVCTSSSFIAQDVWYNLLADLDADDRILPIKGDSKCGQHDNS